MTKHGAEYSMLGYLYQVRYALYLLLNTDNTSAQISIEKFDDIAFEDTGTPQELIQLKHHTRRIGNLTDKSVDIWRTMKVWIDMINNDCSLLSTTHFVIITTAQIPKDSAAEKINKKEYDTAYSLLKAVAAEGENQGNSTYYQAFLSMEERTIISLLSKIKILPSAPNIVDKLDDIKAIIRYSCRPAFLDSIAERIEGWWLQQVIIALMSENAVIMSNRQLHDKILEISRQYDDDNLPIEFGDLKPIEEADFPPINQLFLEQLKLIQSSNKTLRFAQIDYYRASKQRSSWIRQGLLYANNLEEYEYRLKEAWERAFSEMEEDLQDYVNPTEVDKVKAGRLLFRRVSEQDIRIRDKCNAAYVMRGTYHIMANNLNVGWHVDFLTKLNHLLKGRE